MIKIVLPANLGKALLAFRSTCKNRDTLKCILADYGSLYSTDGRRLIRIPAGQIIENGTYSVMSSGKDGKYHMWLCIEKLNFEFPNVKQCMEDLPKVTFPDNDQRELTGIVEKDNMLSFYATMYRIYQKTGLAISPGLAIDYPSGEGFSVQANDRMVSFLSESGTRAVFMPFNMINT